MRNRQRLETLPIRTRRDHLRPIGFFRGVWPADEHYSGGGAVRDLNEVPDRPAESKHEPQAQLYEPPSINNARGRVQRPTSQGLRP